MSRASWTNEPIRVLVVEDEALVRTLAVEFFSDTGFEVVEAPDADTAIHLLQTEAQRVTSSLPMSEYRGPMDGLMLAHHTRHHWPWIDW